MDLIILHEIGEEMVYCCSHICRLAKSGIIYFGNFGSAKTETR